MRASHICLTCLILALHSSALAQDAVVPPPAKDDGGIELVLQTGHTGRPGSVDCSSDGRLAVTGDNSAAIVWDIQTGRKLRTLRFPIAAGDNVYSTRVSPDGKYVITGMKDRTVVSETLTGKVVRTLNQAGQIEALDFSADGSLLATGSWGFPSTAVLWDFATGIQRQVLKCDAFVTAIEFSSDAKHVATGHLDGVVKVWDTSSGKEVLAFAASRRVRAIAFSPNDTTLAVVSGDSYYNEQTRKSTYFGGLSIWNIKGQKLNSIQNENSFVSVTFAADGKSVITGASKTSDWTGELTVWQTDTLKPILRRPYEKGVSALALLPDGKQLMIAAGRPQLVDLQTGETLRVFGETFEPRHVAMSADRKLIVTGNETIWVLWDVNAGKPIRFLEGEFLTWADFSTDGHILLWKKLKDPWRKQLCRWEWESDRLIPIGPIDERLSDNIALGRRMIATGEYDPSKQHPNSGDPGVVKVFDVASGKRLHTLKGHTGSVSSIAISAVNRMILSGSWQRDHHAILWDAGTGRELHRFNQTPPLPYVSVQGVAFSPDGTRAVVGWHGQTVVFDIKSGKQIHKLETLGGSPKSIVFSADGRMLITSGPFLPSTVWDATTGKEVATLKDRTDWTVAATIDLTRKQAVTSSLGGAVRFWDLTTGNELAQILTFDRDWLIATPSGCFDGTAAGRGRVAYRVGGGLNVAPVDRFFQDYYRPGLLAEITQGQRPVPEVSVGKSPPPKLVVLSPRGGKASDREATIEVEARDQGGGAAKLAIFQNDARILAPGETRREGAVVRRSFNVVLVEGKNQFSIRATNEDGSWEAEPVEVVLEYNPPVQKKSELYLLAVGVNKYADATLSLNYAASDAKAMAELFRKRGESLYGKVHVLESLDSDATRDRLRDALRQVAKKTQPEDTLIVFFAGHGAMVGQRYYFLPHEFRKQQARLEDDIRGQGLPADEISDILGSAMALKRVLLLDTCASGGALRLTQKGRSGIALRGAIERLSRAQGVFTVAASAATEESLESKDLGHGVLSYVLLAGMDAVDRGPLADERIRASNPDGVIDVMEWITFASGHVPRVTAKLFGASQEVQTSMQGTSFPILRLE